MAPYFIVESLAQLAWRMSGDKLLPFGLCFACFRLFISWGTVAWGLVGSIVGAVKSQEDEVLVRMSRVEWELGSGNWQLELLESWNEGIRLCKLLM
jgi:hypothetical protein